MRTSSFQWMNIAQRSVTVGIRRSFQDYGTLICSLCFHGCAKCWGTMEGVTPLSEDQKEPFAKAKTILGLKSLSLPTTPTSQAPDCCNASQITGSDKKKPGSLVIDDGKHPTFTSSQSHMLKIVRDHRTGQNYWISTVPEISDKLGLSRAYDLL